MLKFRLLLLPLASLVTVSSASAQLNPPNPQVQQVLDDYVGTMRPAIIQSLQDSLFLDMAFGQFENWFSIAFPLRGESPEIMSDLNEAKGLLNQALTQAVNKAANECAAAYDPKLEDELAHWVDVTQKNAGRLADGPGFALPRYLELAATCTEFTFEFDSSMSTPRPGGGIVLLQLRSTFALHTARSDKGISFTGFGPLEYARAQWDSDPGCSTQVTTQHGNMFVSAADLPMDSEGGLSVKSLTLTYSPPQETVDVSCPNGGIHQGPLSTWALSWNMHHMSEISPGKTGFLMMPWALGGAADAFATWQYSGNGHSMRDRTSETSTIKLTRRSSVHH
jgi:hypothetical protein